jgi:DinB superfamily
MGLAALFFFILMISTMDLRYPIGPFEMPKRITAALNKRRKSYLRRFPALLAKTVKNMTEAQLDTPYRPDGWTVRQVVHHLADSHSNALIRVKWALTENEPTIKAYDEKASALLPDYKMPLKNSLLQLQGVHGRWIDLLDGLDEEQLKKTFIHPATGRSWQIQQHLALYDWHAKHHLAHVLMVIGA